MRTLCHAGVTWLVLGLAALLADTPVFIETRPKPAPADRAAERPIRVDSNLVLISVSVIDPLNRPVTGLDKENFKVFENKIEQRVLHLSREDEPLAVGVVFDSSGSMRKKMEQSRAAVIEFLKTANPDDEFFLVEFNSHARLALPYTSNTAQIQNELAGTNAHGKTALFDGIYLGLQELRKSSKPRKALVIVSDGGDNSSRYTRDDVRHLVQESDVLIYAMGVFESSGIDHLVAEEAGGPDLLDEIAEQSGGRLFPVKSVNDLPDAAARIGAELRNHYLIGYAPADLRRDGKYHKVQVKVAAPHGSRALRVASRPGYYAPIQ